MKRRRLSDLTPRVIDEMRRFHDLAELATGPNPSGLCMCGCGQPTPLARCDRDGLVIGQPTRFVHGHHKRAQNPPPAARITPDRYRIEDRGYTTPCWIWVGTRIGKYGVISYAFELGKRCNVAVHRLSYEVSHGAIPDGYHVHHECSQTTCLNPAHLRALSPAEHARTHHAQQTHCKRGHEFTPENTRLSTTNGSRQCRACERERWRARAACGDG